MANSAHYRVHLRRRREGKTDYQARKAMVVSGRVRLVVRPSVKNISVQIIIAKPIGDQVLVAANSRELVKKYGWKAATGNTPAAYLTGLLCGLKAKTAGINNAILDIGMFIPTKGSKVFAVLNGVIDAGVEVPHGEGKIVKERNKGEHIASYADELGADSEDYKAKFSTFIAAKIPPETLPEHYSQVKAALVGSFKEIKVAPEPETKLTLKKAPTKEKALFPKEKAAPAKEKTTPVGEKAPASKEEAPKPKAPDSKTIDIKDAPAKSVPEEKAPKVEKKAPKDAVKEVVPAKKAKAKAAPKKKAPAKKKTPAKEKAIPAKEKSSAKKATKKGENKQ